MLIRSLRRRVEELENALASLHTALATLCHRDQSAEGVLKDYLSEPIFQQGQIDRRRSESHRND